MYKADVEGTILGDKMYKRYASVVMHNSVPRCISRSCRQEMSGCDL